MSTDSSYRELSEEERKILSKLLENKFQGRDEIEQQIENSTVRSYDKSGSIEFKVEGDLRAHVKQRIPVEASASSDGPISILLHVLDGRISELEIVRYASEEGNLPNPDQLDVKVN